MVARETILADLPPYKGHKVTVTQKQSVGRIIREILSAHRDYAPDYDRIAQYFVADNAVDTERRLFGFCKDNLHYKIEKDETQTVRSPTAILILDQIQGVDCKHFASFIGGVLDAINRTGEMHFDWFYRFASYSLIDRIPEHVFVVVRHGSAEVWIDPVLPYFNCRFPYPVYVRDVPSQVRSTHKVAGIGALQRISGIGALQRISGTPAYRSVNYGLARSAYSTRTPAIGATGQEVGMYIEEISPVLAVIPVVGWVAAAVGEVVGFFLTVFGSKYTTSTGVRWLVSFYEKYVLGENVNSDNKVNEADTDNAQKWFTYVLGVPIYDQFRLHALWGTSAKDGSSLNQTRAQRAAAYLQYEEVQKAGVTSEHAVAATYIADQLNPGLPPGSWKAMTVAPWLVAAQTGQTTVTQPDGEITLAPAGPLGSVVGWARSNPGLAALVAAGLGYGVYVLTE